MKKLLPLVLCLLFLFTFSVPQAMADLETGFEKFEDSLITEKPPEVTEKKKGSNWWKWGLGILAVGAIGAAAGGGGGSSSGGSSGGTGSGDVAISW
ncbi:MAG: hypothetical protein KKB30_13145 [Proteobacteria bacterium]|nr:hypothetical protein [Pseudomonadota bacterium]MBU1716821.1 hypothetical protein [Pseudomonadota bacterium]